MKTMIVALAAFSLSVPCLANTLSLPKTLRCQAIKFVSGLPNFRDQESKNFPLSVEITSQDSAMISPDLNGSIDNRDHKTIFYFTEGGDEHTILTFKASDLDALAKERVQRISGIFEQGADWAHGFYLRARFLMSCSE